MLRETHPKLIEELVPKTLSVGEIQKVLQNLLREKVSIRDLDHHLRNARRLRIPDQGSHYADRNDARRAEPIHYESA